MYSVGEVCYLRLSCCFFHLYVCEIYVKLVHYK